MSRWHAPGSRNSNALRRRTEAVDILLLLIPLSVVLILAVIALFAWALHAGQFDDLEREGERILADDEAPR